MNEQKNNTLELLKLFASYMVVFIHVLFYGRIGIVFDALARFAVPFFFLISGFYSYQITTKKIKKRIINILSLLIFATVCYTIFKILPLLLQGNIDGIACYFKKYMDFKNIVKLLVFNIPISSLHLWYLFAAIYVYVIFYFLTVIRLNEKVIFIISFSLLFLHILLGECLSVFGIIIPIPIVRNFALMGFPFFTIGMVVKKYENNLCVIPNYMIAISAIIGVFTSICSRCFFGENELYIGSLFILFAIVCVFIKYSTVQFPSFLITLAGCSTYIYIFHIMISSVIEKMYTLFGMDISSSVILTNIHPIFVCLSSTAFAYCITKILQKTK